MDMIILWFLSWNGEGLNFIGHLFCGDWSSLIAGVILVLRDHLDEIAMVENNVTRKIAQGDINLILSYFNVFPKLHSPRNDDMCMYLCKAE